MRTHARTKSGKPGADRRGGAGSAPSPTRESGELVYGLRAALAVFTHRREAIERVAFAPELEADPGVRALLEYADARRLPVGELDARELERFAGTSLHEGLCVETRGRSWIPAGEMGARLRAGRGGKGSVAVALDRVRNPYNVGAILRTSAFFGVDSVLLGAPAPHPALASDAVRVAEGGAECVGLARTTDLAESLARIRAHGVRVVGADSDPRHTVSAIGFAFGAPTVLVLGHEREGLSDRVLAQCDARVTIPGAGEVESLNVSVAAGVLISELVRGLERVTTPGTVASGASSVKAREPERVTRQVADGIPMRGEPARAPHPAKERRR